MHSRIEAATAFAASQLDTPALWQQVRQTVSNLLHVDGRQGKLAGNKPQAAFYVTCDRTTMTEADIDHGRLIFVVGVATQKPDEFTVLRFSQTTGGSH